MTEEDKSVPAQAVDAHSPGREVPTISERWKSQSLFGIDDDGTLQETVEPRDALLPKDRRST